MYNFSACAVTLDYGGGKRAIRQFDLVFSGNVLGIYGAESAGKTSLLNGIAGLQKYDGSFYLNGQRLNLAPHETDIFYLNEAFCLMQNKTVNYNLKYPLKLRNYSENDIKKRVNIAINEFGLENITDTKVKNLNKATQAKIGMAKIKLRPAKLYLFDNVLRYFKDADYAYYKDKLKEIIKNLKGMVILASSDFEELKFFADKIAVLYGGVIEQYGTTSELLNSPSSVLIVKLTSNGKTEFIESVLEATDNNLILDYKGKKLILNKEYRNRLLSDDFIGDKVFVAEHKTQNDLTYLIMDALTEKSILK